MALNLITNRTLADATYAKMFQGKRWDDLSPEQKAEYLLGLKGAYSHADFNRVENAVKYLSEILNAYGYPNQVIIKNNWTPNDIQKVSEIQRYIDNIAELKDKYYSNVEGTMPTTSTWLSIEGANYLEKILVNIESIIISMEQVFVRSGVANCGQSRVWQQRFRREYYHPVTYISWNNLDQESWDDFQESETWSEYALKEG